MKDRLIKRPSKRLGQNFLSNKDILEDIVEAADVTSEDTIVEIGPGYGDLTRILARRAKKVIAIELDSKLYEKLKTENKYSNLEVVNADILNYPFGEIKEKFKVVSNPPYYLTTPLLYRLIENCSNIEVLVLTLQKEVAQRVVAPQSCKSYGSLTVYYQMFSESKICFEIDRENFYPVPDVDSAVLRVDFSQTPKVDVKNIDFFFKTVKASFSHRRKTLMNSLKKSGIIHGDFDVEERLLSIGIDPKRRGETLTLEEFAKLSDNIKTGE